MKETKRSDTNAKKWTLAILVVALICLGLGFAYKHHTDHSSKAALAIPATSKVDLSGPTKQDKQSGNDIKSTIVNNQTNQNATPPTTISGKRAVVPYITYADESADQVEVGAYVDGIFENNGTCTLALTKNGTTQTVSVTAVEDVNSVDCPAMDIPASSLSSGTWTTAVSYNSASSEGSSTSGTVEVK